MKSKTVFRRDVSQTKALIKAGKIASKTARRASIALGLSVTFIKDGIIYEEKEGQIIEKGRIEAQDQTSFEIKKGTVLHAK
ncbi:hypothetical protein ABI125_08650 [Tamlana crocina]